MTVSSKRAANVSGVSLGLSILFFVVSLLLGLWSGFFSVFAVSWVFLCAALVWFALVLQFHQSALAEQERLDSGRSAGDGGGRIFEGAEERAGLAGVAQRRLVVFEKWFLPIFSGLTALYEFGIGLYLLKAGGGWAEPETKEPLLCAVLLTAAAFVSFLISRYATGMSREVGWKPLRAGGSILLASAVLCFGLGVGLASFHFKFGIIVDVIGRVVPILLVVLGVETALNVVLDIYRPRLRGQYHRAAFDSRLLGLVNEPGGIFRTAAGAIDYQFGFKVSQTWFYKLLEKAILPLFLFGVVTFYLFSCIVTVGPDEEAIIERFGNPFDGAGEVRCIGSGLTFKWPWPIDVVYKYPTRGISEISIGFVPKRDVKGGGYGPLLWGKEHYEKEYMILVATETESSVSETIPVSLVMAAVPVQYRVKDLYRFLYNHGVRKERDGTKIYEAEERLKAICYNELTKFAASAKIEVGDEVDGSESLLGAGRNRAKEVLTERVQAAADEAGLGVEIVFLGLQGIHPPPELAADYQAVVGAVQKKQTDILRAEAGRNRALSELAGSVEEASRLYWLAGEYQKAKAEGEPNKIERLAAELDEAFAGAKGEIFVKLRESQSYAYEKATLSRARGERFAGQLKGYRAAPEIYKRAQRLAALEGGLGDIRKFVVVADENDTQVSIVDLQEKLTPNLYDFGEIEESNKK